MKKKTPHLARPIPRKFTLMIVPNHPGKVRKLTLPSYLPKVLSAILVAVISVLSFSTFHYSGSLQETRQALMVEKINVAELQEENRQHVAQINDLRNQFLEIDDRLAMLSQLESKVLHMVGLQEYKDENMIDEEVSEIPSDDFFSHQFLLVSRSSAERTAGPVYADYEVDVAHLRELIDSQTVNMEQLVQDVENQLEYLDAQPNLWPAAGRISSRFGNRVSPTNRRRTEFHQGLDIANSSGTSIMAAGSGIVTFSGYNGGYGRMIIISHGYGYTSVYAHNSSNLVEVGDRVEKGDLIARMGRTGRATGTHLHFEIRIHGEPVDPLTILQERNTR